MTAQDALANATRGMSREIAQQFTLLTADLQQAYLEWFAERRNRRAAHRDTLEAFAAGWHKRARTQPRKATGRRTA